MLYFSEAPLPYGAISSGYGAWDMSRRIDREYHEARANEELKRAQEADDPAVAKVHRELAALHRRQMMDTVDPVAVLPARPRLSPNWNGN